MELEPLDIDATKMFLVKIEYHTYHRGSESDQLWQIFILDGGVLGEVDQFGDETLRSGSLICISVILLLEVGQLKLDQSCDGLLEERRALHIAEVVLEGGDTLITTSISRAIV